MPDTRSFLSSDKADLPTNLKIKHVLQSLYYSTTMFSPFYVFRDRSLFKSEGGGGVEEKLGGPELFLVRNRGVSKVENDILGGVLRKVKFLKTIQSLNFTFNLFTHEIL